MIICFYGKLIVVHLLENVAMKLLFVITGLVTCWCCNTIEKNDSLTFRVINKLNDTAYSKNSWQYFLQHLPLKDAPIKDYTGSIISNQAKHIAIVNYDVGDKDLQQCADALMRLRAEYLFQQQKFKEIGFHFCSGGYYSWSMYCDGIKPALKGNGVQFISTQKLHKTTHESLRSYLDIVYAYANTISLCKELKHTDKFEVGTVIITPGSPGHTCIVIDEKTNASGEKLFKLAEGYMPAQSIYVLSDPYDEKINPWYRLNKSEILTASYDFTNYELKKFE